MHNTTNDEIMIRKRQAGVDGVVLELAQKGDGFYDVFYTLDVNVGTPPTIFPLLLDTGSSDLWIVTPPIASLAYNPSSSTTSTPLPLPNDALFSTNYLLGGFSGHLYTDTLSIGPYTLSHQALCAAEHVENESLGLGFSGILGFGLGGISAIQDSLENAGNAALADGRGNPVVLNMFDPTVLLGGAASEPREQWFSLVLDRPGFQEDQNQVDDTTLDATTSGTSSATSAAVSPSVSSVHWNHAWPARLGIGTHVDEVVHAFANAHPGTTGSSTAALEAALQTLPLVTTPGMGTSENAYTHWKTRLSGITVYADDGSLQDVRLSRGVDGGAFPIAVLDSGIPLILASRAVADALYSVWDVQMSEDGKYYVPCNKPLNITITLAAAPPIPIHPLDMSTYVNNDRTGNPTNCLGTLQVSPMLGTTQSPADVALGVSFLRNVYTVHHLASTTTGGGTTTSPIPNLAVAPLTNPTLALAEFQNVRVRNLSPSGAGAAPPPMSGSPAESLSTAGKILLGVGSFLACIIILFAARWFVLRRRFNRLRAAGKLSSDGHGALSRSGSMWTVRDGVAGVAEMIRRKTTLRAKKRRQQKERGLGGWRPVSEDGHAEEGLEGAVATKSAIGHGGGRSEFTHESRRAEGTSGIRYANAPVIDREMGRRPAPEREGTGPFAGFSLWTFVGAKRLLGPRQTKGNYARTANPGLGDHELDGIPPVPPLPPLDGLLTEDELRAQRFAEHQRRVQRENASSVWSDVTWVERGDGTLVPAGTPGATGGKHLRHNTDEFGERRSYGYVGTPNETVFGNTAPGKGDYFPKGQGDSDDESTEKGSTLHGGVDMMRKGGPPLNNPSREGLPLLAGGGSVPSLPYAPGSHSRSGSGGSGQAKHGPYPSLEMHHPPRMDSSGIITASPYPMTPAQGSGGTPPSSNTPPNLPSTPNYGSSDAFNPFSIPTTIPAAPTPLLVHPAKLRAALAVEPNLSPLTEVNSSEFQSTNRTSIMSFVQQGPTGENRKSQEKPNRQSSVSAMSMESEVLVPLPISLMNLPRSSTPPPLPVDVNARELLRQFDFTQSRSPPPQILHSVPVPKAAPVVQPPPTSQTLPPQPVSKPFYPPSAPVAPVPIKHTTAPTPARTNNPFDLLASDDFALGPVSKDSRFPSLGLGAKDSRFPTFESAPRPGITGDSRTSSADQVRPVAAPITAPLDEARPRLRTRATELEPRPQSEAISFGAAPGLPAGTVGVQERPWMKHRAQSGGNASLPRMNPPAETAVAAPVLARQPPAVDDFTPPHEYHPARPEQHTLPTVPSQQRSPPLHRTSEPASSSMGPRSRGPRPMVGGPRSSKSTGSSSSTQSPHSPPASGSRQGTNYDSPLPLPSASSPGASTSSSSLPPGAQPPSDPRPYHRLPSIPSHSSSTAPSTMPTIPSLSTHAPHAFPPVPSSQYPPGATRGAPSRSATGETNPEAAYGGMESGDGAASNWREEAAKTAGVAGVGARSRFTGAMNPSPFDDRP
ncbi:hypothetical protein M408DRAFT_333632 [Serendipita vermifera MAFF 305830]|uniref:Peptidase A1 domain-containing protein n=1 Tax=Serendipita vermifera MAFF 305830 TaxID=933852 RepID=A0A0C3A985_SERVB|nr:hypothetical protein M408DRAFT_333632 [Serendipita vermifera MAFF 305830]